MNNYKTFLTAIAKLKNASNPSLFKILNQFNTYVSFAIERACPGTLGRDINYHVYNGKGFATLLEECYDWFSDNESIYKLPSVESFIDFDTITKLVNIYNPPVMNYLYHHLKMIKAPRNNSRGLLLLPSKSNHYMLIDNYNELHPSYSS